MSLLLLKSGFAFDSYSSLGCFSFRDGGSFVVDSLFIVAAIVCRGSVFGPCFVFHFFALLILHSY